MNRSKLTVAFAFIVAALFAFSVFSKGPFPAKTAGAVPMDDIGRSPSAMGTDAADSFRGGAVPAVGRGAAVSVEDAPRVVMHIAAREEQNRTNDDSAREAKDTPPVIAHEREGTNESRSGNQGRDAAGHTGETPLVTPVPSGGGGGVPASRG